MRWRSIKTAPKDGTVLLLKERIGGIVTGLWSREAGCRDARWYLASENGEKLCCYHEYDTEMFLLDPTHWMPLPNDPK